MSYNAQSLLLAAALSSRDALEQIEDVRLTDDGAAVLRAIRTLYEGDDGAQSLERDAVALVIRSQTYDDKIGDSRTSYLAELPAAGNDSVRTLLHALRLKDKRLRLAEMLLRDIPPTELAERLEEYALLLTDDETDAEVGIESLLKSTGNKVPVSPPELNRILNGGMRPGQTAMIFGRPGSCKTLLCVEMAVGFANRGKRVLYIGNEESGEILLMRFLSRMGGKSLADLDDADDAAANAAATAAHAVAMRKGLKNILIKHGITNFGVVVKLIKEEKPDVIILDQLRHMAGAGDGLTQQLESSMRALRAACTRYSIIGLCVSQAGAEAEQRDVLRLTDLDSSKTGVQGAVDLIIGVGVNHSMQQVGKRLLSICRNKISGIISVVPIWVDEQHTKVKSGPGDASA